MTEPETERQPQPRRRPSRFAEDGKTNLQAQFDAQKIAFGPLMFQAAPLIHTLLVLDNSQTEEIKNTTIKRLTKAQNIL